MGSFAFICTPGSLSAFIDSDDPKYSLWGTLEKVTTGPAVGQDIQKSALYAIDLSIIARGYGSCSNLLPVKFVVP